MPQACWDIIWNITGGVIVALLTLAVHTMVQKLRSRAFGQIFGSDLDELYVIYPSLNSPTRDTMYSKPQSQVPRILVFAINLTTLNSNAITRSVSHLAYAIGRCSKSLPRIRSDVEMDPLMDISFVTMGGLTNFKSIDVLDNDSNTFLQFKNDRIVSRSSQKTIAKAEGRTDCALILKIHPANNPERTWLCVAGIGEWGTSGAAWWLSRHWKLLRKRAKNKPFACITKTTIGSDDSTSLFRLFLTPEEVEINAMEACNKLLDETCSSARPSASR